MRGETSLRLRASGWTLGARECAGLVQPMVRANPQIGQNLAGGYRASACRIGRVSSGRTSGPGRMVAMDEDETNTSREQAPSHRREDPDIEANTDLEELMGNCQELELHDTASEETTCSSI